MTLDLFGHTEDGVHLEPLCAGAMVLRGLALPACGAVLTALPAILSAAPLRHMQTPGGHTMSVATSSCGALGWVTDHAGYRYTPCDPLTGQPWPTMPDAFFALAADAAARAGFPGFAPDACLINRYTAGARMSLHQDRNERDFDAPIVSVSLGLPATFLFGGKHRGDRARRVQLDHGDVVVWGGPARLNFHGILPLADGVHPATGSARINLTFRRAG